MSDHQWGVIPGCWAADRWMDAEWQFGSLLIRPISSRASSNVWKQSNTVSSEGWGRDWWGAKGNRLLSSLLSCGRIGWSYNGEAQFSHVIQFISSVQRRWEKPAQINRKDVAHFRKTRVWLMVLMDVLGNRILFFFFMALHQGHYKSAHIKINGKNSNTQYDDRLTVKKKQLHF